MTPPADIERPNEDAGLCASCRHVERITSARGSLFFLCRLSFTDARFVKYPRLPVVACAGHAPIGADRRSPCE